MGIKNIKYVPELDCLKNSAQFFFFITYSNKKLIERHILSYSNLREKLKILKYTYNILIFYIVFNS